MCFVEFVSQYLYLDDEGDYVFNEMFCFFFGSDNYCFIYEYCFKACVEYLYINYKGFYQILDLMLKNMMICFVVYEVVKWLREVLLG